MKYYQVSQCGSCPWFATENRVRLCLSPFLADNPHGGYGKKIEAMQIPDFCPLPDLPRWISVKERLPEPNEEFYYHNVLVALKNGYVGGAIFSNNRFCLDDGYIDDIYPTHWMPYPKGPEEE